MPLWSIYHSPGLYTAEDKQNFANDITDNYVRVGLPRFYVVVAFHAVDPENLFVGGDTADATVRMVIEHIARHSDSPEDRRRISETISQVVAPYTTDRGLPTEFHVDETPRDLWMINGMWPPPAGSEGEKLWAERNATVPLGSPSAPIAGTSS